MKRILSLLLCAVMLVSNLPVAAFAMETETVPATEAVAETTVPTLPAETETVTEPSVPETTETLPTETEGTEPTVTEPEETEATEQTEPAEEAVMLMAAENLWADVNTDALCNTISVSAGQLLPDTCEVVENEIYGYVVNYPLAKGHILSISDSSYVFSVRKLVDGNYNTMLKEATADSFTATEDMTVAMLIRKPDKSALTAEELASIVIHDSQYGMIGVEGSVHRFSVDAKTIDGGTAATRAAIFLPDSYSENGSPTRLIIMTNGFHAHLTDSVWNANTADDVGVMKHYLDNHYAVIIVNNTANKTTTAADWGNPQLVSSYWEAYAYAQKNLNVEEQFSIHSRSMGTFAAIRMMREHPELVKCAVMCGPVLSLKSRFSTDPAFIAKRYGFDDATGGTWEADKVVGYDPYTDVNGPEYDLPPTFWMMANEDATSDHLATIEKIKAHGNDVTTALYTDTDHSGVCRLNIEACRTDSLAFLNAHQSESKPSQPEEDKTFAGKTISILGDSISTFDGVSNNTSYNSTIGNNAVYYTEGRWGVYQADTWWQKTIDALGMKLLVNNSWSGSTVFPPRKGAESVGYGSRCVNLHNDATGEEPDIIAVFIAANDFSYYQDTLGNADIDYTALITDNGDGSFTYAAPTDTCEAYAIMLHKMQQRYPNAEIYCMTPTARRDPDKVDDYADVGQPTAFNAELKKIMQHFGCKIVDLETCGIDKEAAVFDTYMGDGRTHPNVAGMDLIAEALVSVMLGEKTQIHDISLKLTNVSANGNTAAVLSGGSRTVKLAANEGYEKLSVTVTMGGQDVTSKVYADGTVTIPSVTGDVVITASATAAPREALNFRWEFNGSDLASVTENGNAANALTRKGGTVANGVLNNVYYQLSRSVILRHDLPWVVQWECEGDWSGLLLSAESASSTEGNSYLFRTYNDTKLLAFGERLNGQANNYGIALASSTIDPAARHTYRVENRIAADGSNMAWLTVDGVELGAMNNYYISGTNNQNKTVNWLNGRDFTFSYVGAASHALNNMSIDYLQVWEGGEPGAADTSNYRGKVISILSASTSTFAGYIPEADGFNLAHRSRYPDTSRIPDVTDVNQTWWMQAIHELDAKLGINDSWAGSQVLNTQDTNSGDLGPDAAMASLTRIQNLGSNGTPDVILFFGAGNDIGRGVTRGSFDPATAPTEVDLTATKWDSFADAYVAAIMRLQHFYPDTEILAMTTYAMPSYATAAKLDTYGPVIKAICDHYGVKYLDLRDCGVTFDMLPDDVHPNAEGMDYITAAVVDTLTSEFELEAGENTVYSVTHNLSSASASKHYYKGVSAGAAFEETVTADEVTVTMGGKDITASAYADGKIAIANVTGDLVITAKGEFNADGHLQQLPAEICAGTNLWKALQPENIYYTATGWGNTAAGTSWSITFPVKAGDKVWATSLGAYPDNGSTANGIRVTWFDENGVVTTLDRNTVYKEFAKNGYITAPDGAVALNVPMTDNQDHYAVYILNAEHSYENGICTICGEKTPDLSGKTLSILGASISTFAGTSNGAAADTTNSTIRSNVKYYPNTTIPEVGLNDTWWMQVAEDLDLRLLVNNAWSGSAILLERSGTVGAYVDRCVQLHDDTGDNAGEEPDIICIQMGFNDFSYGKDTLGDANIDYASLITADGYGTPSTTMEATAIMLDKITKRYPDAEVYMFNHFKRIGQSASDTALMEQLNASIATVCSRFDVTVVDLYTALTDPAHIGDGRLHPNRLGMDTISEAVKSAIVDNTDYEVTTHTVSFDLDGVTADYGADKTVVHGDSFAVTLSAAGNDDLSVTVTMGGQDITASAYADGRVSISSVTGNVVITAKSVHTPRTYRWEFNGTDLEGDNTLTKTAGTTTDGIFSATRYDIATPVVLSHEEDWAVEWRCQGTWKNSSGSGGRMFTTTPVNADYNARYIFKSNTNGILAMGEKTTTGSHNYGIALADHGIDWTALHTYRLENRIAEDGSNMIWLLVDGQEIGPMTHYYVGTTDKKTTDNWLSGKDFVFPHMGTDTHGFNDCAIEYIQVWEANAPKDLYTGPDFSGKVISILGDSISTFAGYIPTADGFNLEHDSRYPQDNLLTDVNETWWMQAITELNAKLGINDSWRSTEVYNYIDEEVNSTYDGTKACMASTTRIQNLGSNGTPDVILFFGGTNDITQNRPMGTFDPASAPTAVDLTSVKWNTVADAYVAAIMRMQHYYPDAQIVAMLPYYRNNQAKVDSFNSLFISICEHYGVTYVDLRSCGISTADLPDGTHPDAKGMDYITDAVLDILRTQCTVEPGEHTVYSVKHDLTEATASLGYYKGVSAGKSFVETISGENLTVTVTMGGQDITSSVYAGGKISIPAVTGDIVITAKAKSSLGGRLQQLPDSFCAGTNLWTALTPVNEYYTGTNWGSHSSGNVYSVTIPVQPGDQIFATSFRKYGENGNNSSSSSGIRVTFFGENGVVKAMAPGDTYAEFSQNGYLTAPEGATAVNVPMWNGSADNELYLLNAEHSYENSLCTICGKKITDFSGKVISILGDSISTFAGYIPTADGFNLEHLARYPDTSRVPDVTDVSQTWWMQVINELDAKLGINDSWRGATLSGGAPVTTGTSGENAAMSNLVRIQNLGANGTPDIILLYGGTNDLAHVSKVGSFNSGSAPTTADLTTTKWDNLADGFVHTLLRMRHYYPDAQIVAMLPTYTASYYTNAKLAEANAVMAQICQHYGIPYVDLRECGITTAELPDGIHPSAAGMDFITNAVVDVIRSQCTVEEGEHIVYSVSHDLGNAGASKHYYKGISAGKEFTETVSGDNLTVTVTMGGKDITSEVYADGKITISNVTGDVVVTAKAAFSLGDRLAQLPEKLCAGTNLWTALAHDKEYYTESGWGVHSSGKVYSVTIPVKAGDRLWATSFQSASQNGSGSVSGIRVTYFGEDGMLKSLTSTETVTEFSQNGYLTAPEGATAVNVPMWNNEDSNELYILNAEHSFGNWNVSVVPSLTQEGQEVRICSVCDMQETRQVESPDSLDDIAWNGMTYRDIFIENNIVYVDGFNMKTFAPFVQSTGTNTITEDACYSGPYSLAAFGSPSQQVVSPEVIGAAGEYFLASKVWCTRYEKGTLGVCLGTNSVGLSEVSDGFVTTSGIVSADASNKAYLGSFHTADLDGYVDDPVAVKLSIFEAVPTEEQLTQLYNNYADLEKARDREEVRFTEQEMLDAFVRYMNSKAASIGMTDSAFKDPIGIDNRSTAEDLLRLMVHADTYPELKNVWNQASHTVTVGGENAREQNVSSTVIKPELENYYHILGGKTGTLSAHDARNLAVILEIPDSSDKLAVVVLYADGQDGAENNRYEAARQAADAAMAKYRDPNADTSAMTVCCDSAIACLIPAEGADLDDLNILYEKEADTQKVPASITKVLTSICAIELMETLNTTFTYSQFDTQIGSFYAKDFAPGDKLSYHDALYAMLLPSSNITARAVARTVGEGILEEEIHIHTYESVITAPTCTEKGYTTHTCACGDSYVDSYVDATGEHSYDQWTKVDTDTRKGTCSACGDVQTLHRMTLPANYSGLLYAEDNVSGFWEGTRNVASILGLKSGTFTSGGVTVTVGGTNITVSGTPTDTLYFDLQTGEFGKPDYTRNVGYSLPDGDYRFGIHGSGTQMPTVCIRYPDGSGNLMTASQTTGVHNVTDVSGADFGIPYLYFPKNVTYDFSGHMVLAFGNNAIYDAQVSEVSHIEKNGAFAVDGYLWSTEENVSVFGNMEPISQDEKKCQIIYTPGSKAYIQVYIPQEEGYLQIRMNLANSTSKNAYGWRLDMMYACDDYLNEIFPITQSGEYEAAIKLEGRPDFMGMGAHGSEQMTSFAIYVDGKETTLDQLTALTQWESIEIVRFSDFYDPADETTVVAHHMVEYRFDRNGLTVEQDIEWLVDETCAISYMMMFPVRRTYENLQITDTYFDNYDSAQYDVSQEGFKTYPANWTAGATKLTLFSEKSGVTASMESVSTSQLTGTGYKQCSNSSAYNKLYFTICGGGSTKQTVAAGDVWSTQTRYEVTIQEGTDVDNACAFGHEYTSVVTAPTCSEKGYTTHICTVCGDSYVDSYVDATGEHSYDDGVCTACGTSVLGSEWIAPDFAKGDYTMVVLPDSQNLVTYWPETYYNQMQWIADNRDGLNIQAVMHMGDMVNNNNNTEWTISETGTDILENAGIPWMPMRGNHDDSAWFNRYYDYATYGTSQSWFGGSYHADKLDHTYWFVNAGGREYLILSLGWAPSWDVLAWAQGIVEANPDKNVILNCHAYMNKDGTLLSKGDSYCVSSYLPGYPDGDDVWAAFQSYENVVLAMGGHIHSADVVKYVDQNGAGRDVTSLLFDRQDDDNKNRLGMVALLTFHADSNTVDINWYSTRYDALYRAKNQFAIEVPHVCEHVYESVVTAPTCTEKGYTTHTCTACGDSYVDSYVDALGHTKETIAGKDATCTVPGITAGSKCIVCGQVLVEREMIPATGHDYENGFCTVCNSAEENLWEGSSAVFVGDSITAGTGTDKIYYQYLKENLGFGSVTAMGVPGSCISAASDYGQSNQPLINRYQNIPSADLIVIFMGTNDYGHETPLGSPEDAQDGTFYGALNTIIPALVEKHTSSKIVFVTPVHRYGFGTSKLLGTAFTSDSIPNGVGAALGDYVEALKTVCANHVVPVIDLYTECTLDPADAMIRAEYMPDGLHPNTAGHEVIAGIMEAHIRNYAPVEEPDVETELIYGNKFASGYTQQNRASARLNLYLKAGTVITLKDPVTFQWACVKTSDENSSTNLGYFPDGTWTDKETAVVAEDGWIGFVFKYRDETQSFDLSKPLSDYITIEEAHIHSYESTVTAPTCTEKGYTTHTCTACGDSYVDSYVDSTGHSFGAWVTTTAATCTAKGAERRDCANCDHYETREIAAKGHTEVIDKAVAATCTTPGKTEGKHCSVCGTVLVKQETVAATGHSYGAWTTTTAATCTAKGAERRDCANCDHYETREIAAKGHTEVIDKAVAATCTTPGKTEGKHCSVCGTVLVKQETVAATGHSFGAWTTTTAATCTAKGMERRDCNNCDHYEVRETEAKGHTEVIDKAVAATCTASGKTEGKHCSVCGTVLKAQETIPALGHSWNAGVITKQPTETVQGEKVFTCNTCGVTKTEPIPVLGHTHSYTSKVTAPTCTAKGYTTHTCICGHSYTDSETAATGHSFGAWVTTTAATCTAKGMERRDCNNCDHYEVRETEAKGHTEVIDKAVAATCTTPGKTEGKHCSVCGTVLKAQETISALGHAYGLPSFTWAGERSCTAEFACERCQDTQQVACSIVSTPAEGCVIYVANVSFGGRDYFDTRIVSVGTALLWGDVNQDGKVNFKDAVLILQYASGRVDQKDLDLRVADVNDDGKYNFKDAVLILQKASGRIDKFPVE